MEKSKTNINFKYFLDGKQCKLYRKSLKKQRLSIIRNSELPKVKTALEDFEKNHNWSWYDEIYDRNKDNLDAVALFYCR